MELIYLYVEKFADYIYKQGIQFTNNFTIELKDKKLLIKRQTNYLKKFYGNKIENISVFVGKNGSGKTTLLDILGMNRQDRLRNSVNSRRIEDEYFLLYYIGKDDSDQDLFGIEIMGENILHNMFTNYDNGTDDEGYDKSKTSIGKIYKYENEKFISIGQHFFDYRIEDEKLSELIRFEYIGESYRFSKRNQPYGIYNTRYDDYIAPRKFIPKSSIYQKYLTLNKCITKEIEGFECDKAKIVFWDDVDDNYDSMREDKDYIKYEEALERIKKKLYIKKRVSIFQKNAKNISTKERKESYILDLYSRYAINMLVYGLYPYCKRKMKNINVKRIDIRMFFNDIVELDSIQSSYKILGEANNFREELNRIEQLINELYLKYDKQKTLLILTRYIGSRMHSDVENEEFGYVSSVEDIITCLYNIPETCFGIDNVTMMADGTIVTYVEELLKTFNHYEQLKEQEVYSEIGTKIKISFELLSEGEERFIDTITKINDSIISNTKTKLLVLLFDEPDQSLHPEWSRRFMDIIIQVLESMEFKGSIQIVVSTHSPYILSDMLPRDVFLLKREGNDRMLHIHPLSEENSSCLGANIYDMMKEEFFMDNIVGEFATKKINSYIKRINQIDIESKDIPEIDFFVEQLGEPIIKKTMKKKLEEKLFKVQVMKNKENILELIENVNDRMRVKEYLQRIGADSK